MKAISVRQPWAELIILGEKTVEVRKLNTAYRGPLLIHAASIRGTREFLRAKIDHATISSYEQQAIIGVVDLKEIKPLDKDLWDALYEQHLIRGNWSPSDHKYAWFLENSRRVKPIHYIGLPAIFSIDKDTEAKVLKNL